MSNAAPTSAHVCSVIPPTSMTIAPLFTLNPSMSSVDARPPTLSRRSDDQGAESSWASPRRGE
jgi:hypothetical protein